MSSIKFLLLSLFIPLFHLSATDIKNDIKTANYIFCVDGGGSKTELVVLNAKGERQLLQNQNSGKTCYSLTSGSSNLASLKKEELHESFEHLFNKLLIGENKIPAQELLSQSVFIGGFAGAANPEKSDTLPKIIEDLGFENKNVTILSDAAMAVELVKNDGGILISGTGSICFMKKDGTTFRFGGLGYRIADEGSGYEVGLKGIRAAIEQEYEYGNTTSLRDLVAKSFDVDNPKQLIASINHNKESPAKIASIAKIVFTEAWKGDKVSYQIINNAADNLAHLAHLGLMQTQLKNPYIYLIGGLFKNEHAEKFIQMIVQSSYLKNLNSDQKPLFINASQSMITELVVRQNIIKNDSTLDQILCSLPITEKQEDVLFKKKYDTSFISTEQSNQKSASLSDTFHMDSMEGLQILNELDNSVIEGAVHFCDELLNPLLNETISKIKQGGRLFLVGSGSSGRIAIDLAAKWKCYTANRRPNLEPYKDSVYGVIAGGAHSFVKAKEGFEDSHISGYSALEDLRCNSNDVVILISASGSAQFNIGAGTYAHEKDASCFYFYNSQTIPERTSTLIKEKNINPLLVDIGAQSIAGSTRLQAASLAELCLGITLNKALNQLDTENEQDISPYDLITQVKEAYTKVGKKLPHVNQIVEQELQTFLHPDANFRRAHDETNTGYVTFIASKEALREVMIDTTETAPTFSTNPPRSINDLNQKKAEFRAYLIGEDCNVKAWERLVGRKCSAVEHLETSSLIVSIDEPGYGSFSQRIESPNNLVIGVLKSSGTCKNQKQLIQKLKELHEKGVKTGLIAIDYQENGLEESLFEELKFCDNRILIKGLKKDPLGITSTLALKKILNLISNASMIGMNKVHGNVMIDLSASNNKLIDRTIRIIQKIYSEFHPNEKSFKYETLYQFVTRAHSYKKIMESQLGMYVPPCSKLVLTMLEKNCSVEDAIEILQRNNENIKEIFQGHES
ncbi:MAG: N-acetylmuramic acid 6-phosphate etherase [Chlamydiae bacterium]|nr:N-acetylmuramic acid 6-phosphate etherase [Chlamydiota bacterium]